LQAATCAPRVDTVTPALAWPAAQVDVHGRAFVTTPGPGQPRVEVSGIEADVVSWSPLGTSLRFIVPDLPQGPHDLVVVRNDGLRIASPEPLAVVPPLEVHFEAPILARPGDTILLAGANFTYPGLDEAPRVETSPLDAPDARVPLDVRLLAPDLLGIQVPDHLTGAHAGLYVTRGDGVAWSSPDFGIHVPHLEVRVVKKPDDAPTLAPRDAPDWILAVFNMGTIGYTAASYPTMLEIHLEQQHPPYGRLHRLVPIENDLAPGEAVEVAIRIDPLCDCPALIEPFHLPAGEWQGHATLHKDAEQDPLPHGAHVALRHTFLFPATGER
jgi:hypothetical protein